MNQDQNGSGNGNGEGTPAHVEPPPPYQPPPGPPEVSLEAIQYMEEQRRQAEMRALHAQIYCAALTGIMSGTMAAGEKITATNAAQMALMHANAGMQHLAGGIVQQAPQSYPQQQVVQQPPQQPQQAMQRYAPPAPPVPRQQGAPYGNPYANPYQGPQRFPTVQGAGYPAQGMQGHAPPGSTPGPSGQIQTGLGAFQYQVHYGPPGQRQ